MKIIYFVADGRGRIICGPFAKEADAEKARENYSGVCWYGDCNIIKKSIERK